MIVDENHLAARPGHADGLRDGLASDVLGLLMQQEEDDRLVELMGREG